MKNYKSYMDRQELSPEGHEKLLRLASAAPGERSPKHPWRWWGALAACCALALGMGLWRPALQPQTAGDVVAPEMKDTLGPGETPPDGSGFVVKGHSGKLMVPALPYVNYQSPSASLDSKACIAFPDGSFHRDLTKEQIQEIFWGAGGGHETEHPKNNSGDLPWMLFWDGYTITGRATYDGAGKLFWLYIWGKHPHGGEFTLVLCPDRLPPTDLVEPGRKGTDVRGVAVIGWSQSYDRNGDGVADAVCGSEFVAGDVGVRFENVGSPFTLDSGDGLDEMAAARQFNALLVNWATYPDRGLYLDHLLTTEDIPAWRVEEFSSLAQARQEAEFAPYLPQANLPGYGEFYGRLTYQEERENTMFVRWSRGYDDVEVHVDRSGTAVYNLADADDPASYDLRLYEIPWCDSVPQAYWETVNSPAFRAEDMSREIVEARVLTYEDAGDSGGPRIDFEVLHPDGTLVRYACKGLSAGQVWALVEDTLEES